MLLTLWYGGEQLVEPVDIDDEIRQQAPIVTVNDRSSVEAPVMTVPPTSTAFAELLSSIASSMSRMAASLQRLDGAQATDDAVIAAVVADRRSGCAELGRIHGTWATYGAHVSEVGRSPWCTPSPQLHALYDV